MRVQLSRVGLTRLRIYFTKAIKPFRIIVTVFGSLDTSSAVKQFEPSLSLCLPVLQLNFAVFNKRAIPLWIIFFPRIDRIFLDSNSFQQSNRDRDSLFFVLLSSLVHFPVPLYFIDFNRKWLSLRLGSLGGRQFEYIKRFI